METSTENKMNLNQETRKTFKVFFLPMNVEALAQEGESILDVAENFGVNFPHNCGGVCACSTCHVIIKSGLEHLNLKSEDEEDRLDMAENLTLDSRLGCQARIYGDITLTLPECTRKE